MKKLKKYWLLAIGLNAILVCLIFGGLYTSTVQNESIEITPSPELPTQTFAPVPTLAMMPTITQTVTMRSIESHQSEYTFVLLGEDYMKKRLYNDHRTDAFMVMNIRTDMNPIAVTLISLPRELVAWWSPEYGSVKINRVYSLYGLDGIYRLMAEFGLDIDGVILINMDNFTKLINTMGGLDIVPYKDVDDRCKGKHYELIEGSTYHMDSKDVMCYARMRLGSSNGYFDRMKRHFDILEAMAIGMLDLSPLELIDIMQLSYNIVETDMSYQFILKEISTNIISALQGFTLYTTSMDNKMLRLLDRPDESYPYLYTSLIEWDAWMDCVLSSHEIMSLCNNVDHHTYD